MDIWMKFLLKTIINHVISMSLQNQDHDGLAEMREHYSLKPLWRSFDWGLWTMNKRMDISEAAQSHELVCVQPYWKFTVTLKKSESDFSIKDTGTAIQRPKLKLAGWEVMNSGVVESLSPSSRWGWSSSCSAQLPPWEPGLLLWVKQSQNLYCLVLGHRMLLGTLTDAWHIWGNLRQSVLEWGSQNKGSKGEIKCFAY